jgi:hypothetical protein
MLATASLCVLAKVVCACVSSCAHKLTEKIDIFLYVLHLFTPDWKTQLITIDIFIIIIIIIIEYSKWKSIITG